MTAPIRRRTRAREIAMQALFQFDLRGQDLSKGAYRDDMGGSIEDICRDEMFASDEDEDGDARGGVPIEVDPNDPDFGKRRRLTSAERDMLEFSVRLVEGTLRNRDEIDQQLQGVTRNWDLRRMAIVDRNVLRMAVYELMFCNDVPPKVAINEAIEIGKKYSTANSGGFVNGILDRIRIDLQKSRSGEQTSGS